VGHSPTVLYATDLLRILFCQLRSNPCINLPAELLFFVFFPALLLVLGRTSLKHQAPRGLHFSIFIFILFLAGPLPARFFFIYFQFSLFQFIFYLFASTSVEQSLVA